MKTLIIVALLSLWPTHSVATDITSGQLKTPDPRSDKLTKFFQHYKCPQVNYTLTNAYLEAADKYNIQYQLLPAISIAESSCLRHYRYSNPFGWNSDRTGFASIEAGIDFVSQQLANGHYYKGRTLKQKINAYNPNPAYYSKIISLMNQIENYTTH